MKKIVFLLIVLVLAMSIHARADVALDIKLNFFGPATGGKGGPGVATSFYLKSLVQRNLQVKFAPETLLAELRKTFNAPDVSLLASADLAWRSGGPASVMQVVQIDGRDYALVLTPLPRPGVVNFKVGVVEENDKNNIKNVLLDTEIVLPDGEVAMLGFRDSREHSYFFTLYVQGRDEEFGRNAMRITTGQKPKLLKKVYPVYPEEAMRNRIQGVVVLEAVINEKGKVEDVRTVASATPALDKAAIEALRQWEYAPFEVDGRCRKVMFTVTITFSLEKEPGAKKDGDNALTRLESTERPRKVKDVKPVYPEEAVKNKIEGVVIVEATINEQGKVRAIRVISSPDPLLSDAALKAVRLWEYKPYVKGGKAIKVVFTATVTFSLHKD